jgi:CheY-like chemotaxis protein
VTEDPGPGLRVLLLEDEPANRALIRAIIGRSSDPGIRDVVLDEAPTVAEARAILADHDVDVALLDVRLPDGNGLDIAADLRANGSRARVVIISASVLPVERARALASGADGFLGKPFEAGDLIDLLKAPSKTDEAVDGALPG